MTKKIVIIKVRKNYKNNINEELIWLGNSMGLFSSRDKDKSCFRVFISLLRSTKRNDALSSDEIAERLSLTRGTVVHHLTRLINSGVVIREKEGYLLRENNLQGVIKDMKRDMDAVFEELIVTAQEIDNRMGF